MSESGGGQRIDKWLFFARLAKSRSLAQKIVAAGSVRINRDKTINAARLVRPGDVLTIQVAGRVRVLKVVDGGTRRGPAREAVLLFEDLAPPPGGAGDRAEAGPVEDAAANKEGEAEEGDGDEGDEGAPARPAPAASGAASQPRPPAADGFRPPPGAPSPRERRRLSALKRGKPGGS